MEIFGHRGAAGLVAENTLESIEEAIKHGVSGIEIDVHRCKSGELIVIHDDTLQRTTNGYGKISEHSWIELGRYRTHEGYRIPKLTEVLDLIDDTCVLNIELKGIGTALPVIELLEKQAGDKNWKKDCFVLSSFDHSQLFQIKSMTSAFRLGVLTEKGISEALDVASSLEAFSIHPPIRSLTKTEVSLAKEKGYKIYTWTVNNKTLLERLKNWKVDVVITDFPNFA